MNKVLIRLTYHLVHNQVFGKFSIDGAVTGLLPSEELRSILTSVLNVYCICQLQKKSV